MKKVNKDFYDRLPGFVCEALDGLIDEYSNKEWFDNAWKEYREHILTSKDRDDMCMPGYVFNKYIKGE